jgi:hypothetical protein
LLAGLVLPALLLATLLLAGFILSALLLLAALVVLVLVVLIWVAHKFCPLLLISLAETNRVPTPSFLVSFDTA